MEKGIPEASREVLKQWQAKGLKFNVRGVAVKFTVEFTDIGKNIYTISEQPIPKGMIVETVEAMWRQGLRLEFDGNFGWDLAADCFDWNGIYRGAQLLARLRIPAQPIPEKLLQEPVTELPAEKCVIGQESDPNGLDPHAPGAKLDAGKNRLGLVLGGFARALEQVGLVGTYGAEKYSPNGWCEVPNGTERYDDAMLRHWVALQKGEEVDPATGLPHRAQIIWNALAAFEIMLEENK